MAVWLSNVSAEKKCESLEQIANLLDLVLSVQGFLNYVVSVKKVTKEQKCRRRKAVKFVNFNDTSMYCDGKRNEIACKKE